MIKLNLDFGPPDPSDLVYMLHLSQATPFPSSVYPQGHDRTLSAPSTNIEGEAKFSNFSVGDNNTLYTMVTFFSPTQTNQLLS